MKIIESIFGLAASARGMSIQRKRMDLISQNIANADTVRTENGEPYKRKFLKVETEQNTFANSLSMEGQLLQLNKTNSGHIAASAGQQDLSFQTEMGNVRLDELQDQKEGDLVYMPDHPDANGKGYVEMSNVNVINEMVDMIAATRSYEANLQALNSTKQMVKDSLEI